jgi:hypothetical protein
VRHFSFKRLNSEPIRELTLVVARDMVWVLPIAHITGRCPTFNDRSCRKQTLMQPITNGDSCVEFRAPQGVRKSPMNDPRLAGAGYGDFDLSPVLVVARPGASRVVIDARSLDFGATGQSFHRAERPGETSAASMMVERSRGIIARGAIAGADSKDEPCRVMARRPGSVRCRMAVPVAEPSARRSR